METLNDRYRLQHAIGQGGMSEVFQAYDMLGDTKVAIKQFADPLDTMSEVTQEIYRRELESLRAFQHNNVVRLIDYGRDERARPFLVLELMANDLVAEKKHRPKDPIFTDWEDLNQYLFTPLLDALHVMHNSPSAISHRDIKPSNILVSNDTSRTLKLADFGIAKIKGQLTYGTTLKQYASLPFAPPEADNGTQTFSRDIFSLAITTIWALSPERPEHLAHAHALLKNLSVPENVRKILIRCIDINPGKRFESTSEVQVEIERWQHKQRIEDRSKGQPIKVALTNKARNDLKYLLHGSEDEIYQLVNNDLMGEVHIEQTTGKSSRNSGPRRELTFCLFGDLGIGYVTTKANDDNCLLVVTVFDDSNKNDESPRVASPVRFTMNGFRTGSAIDALDLMADAVASARESDDSYQECKGDIFDDWLAVNDLLLEYQESKNKPIPYSDVAIENSGRMACFTAEPDAFLEDLTVGQSWKIANSPTNARGEIYDIEGDQIWLQLESTVTPRSVPSKGQILFDNFANKRASERKEQAIRAIQSSAAANPQLGDAIRWPEKAIADLSTQARVPLQPQTIDLLDESKQNAIKSIFASRDLALVEGPPGTGKTQLIAGLIKETLDRNPFARILMASQTHVAIENALERTGNLIPDARMVRIASGNRKSSTSSSQYLIDEQVKRWSQEVRTKSMEGVKRWAENKGLDPAVLESSAIAQEIAPLMRQEQELREEHRSIEDERRSHDSEADISSDIDERQEECRQRIRITASRIEDLMRRLKDLMPPSDVNACTGPEDFESLAESVVGDQDIPNRVLRIWKTQRNWMRQVGNSTHDSDLLLQACSVIGGTCVGIARVKEDRKEPFDLCIIDEASKATAAEACIPISMSRKAVLLGDSRQLPPFQDEAIDSGLLEDNDWKTSKAEAIESLFDRCCARLPDRARSMLREQYRMLQPIGDLVSDCFYESKLISKRKISDSILPVGIPAGVPDHSPIAWISTAKLSNKRESRFGMSYRNPLEADHVLQLLENLDEDLRDHPPQERLDTIVLSGYSGQVKLLHNRSRNIHFQYLDVSCCTVDQVQGKEAPIVVYSVTRSNTRGNQGFLKEMRRINVAMSRARDLLLIVGDHDFVSSLHNESPIRKVLTWTRAHHGKGAFFAQFDQ